MTEAPERIWAWPEPDDGLSDAVDKWGWVYGDWDRCEPFEFGGVQYVRADLHAATVARAEKAEAALAEAVEAERERCAAFVRDKGAEVFIASDGIWLEALANAILTGDA